MRESGAGCVASECILESPPSLLQCTTVPADYRYRPIIGLLYRPIIGISCYGKNYIGCSLLFINIVRAYLPSFDLAPSFFNPLIGE